MVTESATLDGGLKAIADSTRRGILGLLSRGQLSVHEIAEQFPMSRPAISKHLRILKEAGLVVETPVGRQRLYTLDLRPLHLLGEWLSGLNGGSFRRSLASSPARYRPRSDQNEDGWRVW